MGSRTARLISIEGSIQEEQANGTWCTTRHGSFTFESGGRTYRVTFANRLQPRNPHTNPRVPVLIHGLLGEDARVEFSGGGRKPRLSSLAVDYDLTPYLIDGDGLPVPRPERGSAEERPVVVAAGARSEEEDEVAALSTLTFDGDALEVVRLDGLGWVSLASLCRTFGKDPKEQRGLLEGWARVRTGRVSTRGGVQDAHLLLHEDVPLFIARLNRRGMSQDLQEKHTFYLRHVARVLAEHFGLLHVPAAPAPTDPWSAIRAIAGGAVELQGRVERVEGQVSTAARAALDATRVAEEAKALAEQAKSLAATSSVAAEASRLALPGGSVATPDGAWSSRLPDGFKSQRHVARDFALPSDGVGAGFVGRVARALGIYDDPYAIATQNVVIGGRARRQHVVYGAAAVERLAPALRAAHATMQARGYTVRHGVMLPASVGPAKRSKTYVLEEMFEAAVSDRVAAATSQTSIPGVDDDQVRKAG